MRYPLIEDSSGLYPTQREMTPEEYENELLIYKSLIYNYVNSPYRRDKEYGKYLQRWFSEEICDGATFKQKKLWHQLPMSFNQYTFE